MKTKFSDILPDTLIVQIAEQNRQHTSTGIAQACICHLIENDEQALINSSINLNRLTSHINTLNI